MALSQSQILVIGCARSGLAAAKLASIKGGLVTVYDQKKLSDFHKETRDSIKALMAQNIQFVFEDTIDVAPFDLLIVSPGVPLDLPFIEEAYRQNKVVLGELEFASSFCKAPIIAITGTNGKTTTTALVGEIAEGFNPKTYIVGNIGRAFSEDVLEITEDSIVVAEVSSFQLETIKTFHPVVSAILNITPDHLNRHKTMENYCQAKYNIFKNQTKSNFCILNDKDQYCKEALQTLIPTPIVFNGDTVPEKGAYVKEGALYENIEGAENYICKVEELKILGSHNIENALAAISITRAFGIPVEIVADKLKTFAGVAHRIEYVNTKNGVDFFNDSKATNTDAAIKGLLAMKKPVRLLAGGMDKKVSFVPWIELFKGRVQKVYVIGETRAQIVSECAESGFTSIATFDTFEEAVLASYHEAKAGECVLLSPACASWDMFESYEERGDIFKKIVHNLEG